ncbi:MAG: mandelate racemase/muconate lactonizing enzyme family protein [Polyangiaceae bacterium]|nr:mandelate racemase/muconate lactonizing enzyme family protein [Polyangiaceae bacterium]
MRNTAGARRSPPCMGRREFLRALGATTVGAVGMTAPFRFARAAIDPGQKGLYITDLCTATLRGLNSNCTIIRLDTNKGIVGYGECRCEDTNSLSELRALKPTILGMNPTQIDRVFGAVKNYGDPFSHQTDTPRHTGAMCAIECACWDITGKVYNVPVWKLLGRRLNDKIRLYCDTPQQNSIAALRSNVQARLDQGFTWFKTDLQRSYLTSGTDYTLHNESGYPYQCITVNPSGFDKWAEYVAAYREMIGEAPLSSDHYQNWASAANLDVPSAIALADLMSGPSYQGMSGGWMEDIIAWYYPEQIKQVADGTDMPILTGEDMYCLEELQPLVDAGAIDYFHPDQSTFGGIHQTRLAAEYAWQKGVRTALHMSGSPFTFVCSLHIAAGIPEFLAMEHHYTDLSWYDSLVDGIPKPLVQNGYAAVPDGPGLGITPNETSMRAHLSGSYFASLT